MYRVALICEGPADRAILEAVLDHYLDDYEPLPIQPPKGVLGGDAGPFGGGWKGVRSWCKDVAVHRGLRHVAVLENADILVIQVDADIAHENEVDLVREWLGAQALPDKVILCVPSMASETWALVALFPDNPAVVPCDPPPADLVCIECRTDIKTILRRAGHRLRPRLVVGQEGRLKNQAKGYRTVQDGIAKGWDKVIEKCGEARRFDREFKRALIP